MRAGVAPILKLPELKALEQLGDTFATATVMIGVMSAGDTEISLSLLDERLSDSVTWASSGVPVVYRFPFRRRPAPQRRRCLYGWRVSPYSHATKSPLLIKGGP